MGWIYHQQTGYLFHNEQYFATGYSGRGAGRNNPDMEDRRANDPHAVEAGPIPRGGYRIGVPFHSSNTGLHAMRLTPIGHAAHGRTQLEIHGESGSHPGMASTGCIVLSPAGIRQQISDSGDDLLQVVR